MLCKHTNTAANVFRGAHRVPTSRRQPLPRQAEEQRGADVDVAMEATPSDVHGFFAERALERLE